MQTEPEQCGASDEEAMSIIRRAAILMAGTDRACLTPGAVYQTQLDLPHTLSIKVLLSKEQSASLAEQLEQHPYRLKYMDNMLHDYFQVAIARILKGNVA